MKKTIVMAFIATCLVTFWKCCCYYGEPGNTFGAPPPQGGSSYGDSEKKVSFESIVLSREACGACSPGSPTGKSLPEAFILTSNNPQYDKRLFIELQVQYMKIASSEHVVYINCFECQNKNKQHVLRL